MRERKGFLRPPNLVDVGVVSSPRRQLPPARTRHRWAAGRHGEVAVDGLHEFWRVEARVREGAAGGKEGGAVTGDCPVDAGTVIACASTTFASVRSSSLILPAHCRSREAAAARTAGSIAASHVRRCTPVAYGKGYALAERDTLCFPALFHLVAHMSRLGHADCQHCFGQRWDDGTGRELSSRN